MDFFSAGSAPWFNSSLAAAQTYSWLKWLYNHDNSYLLREELFYVYAFLLELKNETLLGLTGSYQKSNILSLLKADKQEGR